MEEIIHVEGLSHNFSEIKALNEISFSVNRGEVMGLLGPNGAGKTTTVRLVNGLFRASKGSIRVFGLNPAEHGQQVRERTGVLTETPALYERLTARQNLEFFGTLAGMEGAVLKDRIKDLLGFFDLTGRAADRAGTFSKGMKQRLALARVMLHDPDILFLDEPTSGLDPEAARQVHDWINAVRQKEGKTVVLCSHNLVEAQRLCDRLVILRRGNILDAGSLQELHARHSSGIRLQIKLWEPLKKLTLEDIKNFSGVQAASAADEFSLLLQLKEKKNIPDLVTFLVNGGVRLLSLQPEEASLEDIYFELQGNHKEVSK